MVGVRAIESRFEATRSKGTESRWSGAKRKLALLLRRWQEAKDGEGQVVLLGGEPGVGKSRLTRALRERLEQEPYTPLRYQCSSYHLNSALYPVIEQFERAAGFTREDTPEQKLDKLQAVLAGDEAHSPSRPHCSRATVTPGGALRAAQPLAGEAEGEDAGSARPPGRSAAPTPAAADDLRGRALGRPHQSGSLGPAGSTPAALPVLLIVTYRPEYPALGRSGARHHLGTESAGRRQAADCGTSSPAARRCPRRCSIRSSPTRTACPSSSKS